MLTRAWCPSHRDSLPSRQTWAQRVLGSVGDPFCAGMRGQAFTPALAHAAPLYLPPAASAPHPAHAQRRSVDMGALARTGQAAYGACGVAYGGGGALGGGAGSGGLDPAAMQLLGAPPLLLGSAHCPELLSRACK